MSNVGPEGRSFLTINFDDLRRLAEIAKMDREKYFSDYPESWGKYYRNRFLCSALCQGAALHYVSGEVGINDFDIYNFYIHNPQKNWYAKRIESYDFRNPKFGKSSDHPEYIGRCVDVLGRSIKVDLDTDPAIAIQKYFTGQTKTKKPKFLPEKAVVLLEPLNRIGEIVWPLSSVELSKRG